MSWEYCTIAIFCFPGTMGGDEAYVRAVLRLFQLNLGFAQAPNCPRTQERERWLRASFGHLPLPLLLQVQEQMNGKLDLPQVSAPQ